jgi:hypothetical protein
MYKFSTERWQEIALLQAEAMAFVSGLANVLFCALAINPFFSGSAKQKFLRFSTSFHFFQPCT